MPEARRHHFVPRAYLRRFSSNDRVFVRRRDSRAFETSTLNVAVEAGFYDVPEPELGRSSWVEQVLAGIDGAAVEVLRSVDRTEAPPAEATEDRRTLAVFIALQLSRTREERERVEFPERFLKYADGREIDMALMTEFLENVHLGFRPTQREAQAALDFVEAVMAERGSVTRGLTIQLMFQLVEAATPLLLKLNWTLETNRKMSLITCDVPIVLWRAPTPRDQYEGVGITNAEEVRFPLDPGKQLVLSKRVRTPAARMSSQQARDCNADVAAACHELVVGHPNQRSAIEKLSLARQRPVLRFNTGRFYEQHPDGTTRRHGELLHVWVPRR